MAWTSGIKKYICYLRPSFHSGLRQSNIIHQLLSFLFHSGQSLRSGHRPISFNPSLTIHPFQNSATLHSFIPGCNCPFTQFGFASLHLSSLSPSSIIFQESSYDVYSVRIRYWSLPRTHSAIASFHSAHPFRTPVSFRFHQKLFRESFRFFIKESYNNMESAQNSFRYRFISFCPTPPDSSSMVCIVYLFSNSYQMHLGKISSSSFRSVPLSLHFASVSSILPSAVV